LEKRRNEILASGGSDDRYVLKLCNRGEHVFAQDLVGQNLRDANATQASSD
jgi:hypothetical protein